MTVDNPTLALETAKPRKSTVLAWVVCLTAGLFFFYEFIQMNMLDAISTDLMRGFGITAGKISLLGSVFFIANTVCLFPAGLLLDQLSARKVILWAMGLTVACAIGFALAPTFSLALFFRLLAGTTNAFCFLSCIIIASRWFNPKQMALAKVVGPRGPVPNKRAKVRAWANINAGARAGTRVPSLHWSPVP